MTAFIAFMGSLMAVMFVLAMRRIGELTKESQALRAQLEKKPRAQRTKADEYRKAIERHHMVTTDGAAYFPETSPVRPQDKELYGVLPEGWEYTFFKSPQDAS